MISRVGIDTTSKDIKNNIIHRGFDVDKSFQ